jgi:hypothetical protein
VKIEAATEGKSSRVGRAPMYVPDDFHKLVKKEAERRGMNMTVLLERYGRLMVETVKQQG